MTGYVRISVVNYPTYALASMKRSVRAEKHREYRFRIKRRANNTFDLVTFVEAK